MFFKKVLTQLALTITHFNRTIGLPLSRFGQQFKRGNADMQGHDESLKKWHLVKKLFWTTMFGGTFAAAIVAKRKRRIASEEFLKHYELLPIDPNFKDGLKSYRYKGFVFPVVFGKSFFSELKTKFHPRKDDVYVVSFPKTGTTWVQEIVYLIKSNLDFATANSTALEDRFPFLEFITPGINSIEKMKSPRFIKTHLPLELLPKDITEKNCKIIYITRNPKDVAVSFFHFLQMLTVTEYQGSFKDLVCKLVRDELPYCPFWKHVLQFWERRQEENILFLKYEDMHKDLPGIVRRIANFLEQDLTEDQVDQIVDHCKFSSMQSNPMINYDHWEELGLWKKGPAKFLRKGTVGDWQNYFTPGLDLLINQWIEKNSKETGLTFDYTIETSKVEQEVHM